MNQRELNELRRRFKPDRTAISKVYGCYVSSSRQIISYVDAPLGLLSQEEQEMYLNLLKKSLSGALGRNLIDIEFSTRQVADSDEHRLLQTLRQTELQDPNALPPALGFLFPAFDDRSANIYNALFYSKDTAQLHQEVIDAVFCIQNAPMSPQEQQNVFTSALTETLEKDCSYDVVQAVHEQLRGRIQEHKDSRDPEPLTLSVREVGDVLTGSGVPEEKAEAFQEACRRQYGQDAALNPRNIIEAGKFQITTPEVKITVPPEYSYMVETRIIDGRRFILIPADDGVEVNGIPVTIPNPQA